MQPNHFEYLLYEDSKKIIDLSKVQQRFDDNKEEVGHLSTNIMVGELEEYIEEMNKEGFFDSIPEEHRAEFKKSINNLVINQDKSWNIERLDGLHVEGITDCEIIMLAGWHSSLLFSPKEIWNYKQFGASSVTEFTGTIGAFLLEQFNKPTNKDGRKWISKHPDGNIYEKSIGGNTHGDLNIFQRNITKFQTTDPFGNKVNYRPLTIEDRNYVSGSYYEERRFLEAVICYIDKNNIPSKHLSDNGEQLFKWIESFNRDKIIRTIISDDENFSWDYFINYENPIVGLDENNVPKGYVHNTIGAEHGEPYQIVLGKNKELLIGKVNKNNVFRLSASFIPEDADKIIEGLFYQTTFNLGRTPTRDLVKVIDYRLSERFHKDMVEQKEQLLKK